MSLEQRCRARGLSVGRQRRAIIRALAEAPGHLSAAELHRKAGALDPDIGIATVYRTLAIFEEAGLVRRLEVGDRTTRYEEADREPHDHLLDRTDGTVIAFRAPEIGALLAEVAGRLGYRLDGYRLDLFASPVDKPPPR